MKADNWEATKVSIDESWFQRATGKADIVSLRAFFWRLEQMFVSSSHQTKVEQNIKEPLRQQVPLGAHLDVQFPGSPSRRTFMASPKHAIIHTHQGQVAVISWNSALRSWQRQTGTEGPSALNTLQTRWMGPKAGRRWASSASRPALFGRRRTRGNRTCRCVEGYGDNCGVGRLWVLPKSHRTQPRDDRERPEQKPLTQRAPPREPCPLFTLEHCHMCYLRRIRNIWTCSGGGSCNFRSFAPLLIPHSVFILVPFSGE